VHTHDLTFDGQVLTKRYTSWERGEHRREWMMLRLVHAYAPDLVPEPRQADLEVDPPVVTMSRLPGVPLDGKLSAEQLKALAAALAELWRTPPPSVDWVDDLSFARRLTDGPRPAEGITAEAFGAAVAWWDGPDPELLRTPPPALILGHGDANLANYLWDGSRVRIVDFEDAGPSDPATELAILVEHMSARATPAEEILAAFPAVDERRLRAARRLWAMFWMRLLLPGGPAVRRNPPGTTEKQAERLLSLLAS
jgi:aminoglycoside phosphotransferase (APT) family kinase protein